MDAQAYKNLMDALTKVFDSLPSSMSDAEKDSDGPKAVTIMTISKKRPGPFAIPKMSKKPSKRPLIEEEEETE